MGYSVRDSEPAELQRLFMCRDVFAKQADKALDAADTKSKPKKTEKETKDALDAYLKAFKEGVPSMAELERIAEDPNQTVYLPPVPPYKPPQLEAKRPTRKDVIKKRVWSFEAGDKGSIWIKGDASLDLEAKAVDATVRGRGTLFGAVFGSSETEVLGVEAMAQTFASGPGKARVQVRAMGKTIWDKPFEQKGLKVEKTPWEGEVDQSIDVRFALGPIPMRAQVGFRGIAGVKFQAQVTPLQAFGGVVPFASARAYAQVGIDLGIAGAGVGGELIVAEGDIPLTGSVMVGWQDEPDIELDLNGDFNLTYLSGKIYLFAYVNLIFAKPEFRHTLFEWEGFRQKVNLFHVNWKWKPSGVTASGTLDASDVMELQAVNGEVRVAEAEEKSIAHANAIMGGIAADMSSPRTLLVAQTRAGLAAKNAVTTARLEAYERTLKEWAAR